MPPRPAVPNAAAPACARCGTTAEWIVTVRYDDDSEAGRLLAYCDPCRRDGSDKIAVAIPWAVMASNPTDLIDLLYAGGYTESDRDIALDLLGLSS